VAVKCKIQLSSQLSLITGNALVSGAGRALAVPASLHVDTYFLAVPVSCLQETCLFDIMPHDGMCDTGVFAVVGQMHTHQATEKQEADVEGVLARLYLLPHHCSGQPIAEVHPSELQSGHRRHNALLHSHLCTPVTR